MVMTMKKYVAYYRVSTQKQGESGLGLEAQRRCVAEMVSSRAGEIIADFQDIESGKKNDRPELLKAIRQTKEKGATLIIAKLDRLARNAAFILELRDSGIEFVACDIPEANSLTIGIMAILAQQERETISARTKAALQAKKHRGDTLGKPENFSDQGRAKGASSMKAKAATNTNNRRAVGYSTALKAQGLALQAIADRLNAEGYETAKGKQFEPMTVKRLLDKG
jgi:DNA invertase Pin-like site-specific DNA recombinase